MDEHKYATMTPLQRRAAMSQLLIGAYHDHCKRHGNMSQTEYAKQVLGQEQSNWTVWVNENRLPTQEYAEQLAAKLGPEVYAITGIRPRVTPEMAASRAFQLFHRMTPEQRQEFDNFAVLLVDGNDNATESDTVPAA